MARPPAKVLLVVSGGIAAYKAPALVRALVGYGMTVQVVTTPAATAFVTELSLSTVSGRAVRSSLLEPAAEGAVGHIEMADWADLVVVAPATADLIARAALGLAGDLASTVLLASRAPVLWAPAMNTNMWEHPATQRNLAELAARGHHFVGPDAGALACGWVGTGRMIDPPTIAARAHALSVRDGPAAPWAGRHVLVSAGPTRAFLDPVRFLTNDSTGTMGFALAAAAQRRGAQVTLVAGPVSLPTPPGVRRRDVTTAQQMLAAMTQTLEADAVDWVAMVAAVTDLRAATVASQKVPKAALAARLAAGAALEPEVDILATLVERHGRQTRFLGFGAQTLPEQTAAADVDDALRALGEAKLVAKACDALFVNRVGRPQTGFGPGDNAGVLVWRQADGEIGAVPSGAPMPKAALAAWLLDQLHPGPTQETPV